MTDEQQPKDPFGPMDELNLQLGAKAAINAIIEMAQATVLTLVRERGREVAAPLIGFIESLKDPEHEKVIGSRALWDAMLNHPLLRPLTEEEAAALEEEGTPR